MQDPYWNAFQPYKATGQVIIADFVSDVSYQLKYPNITTSNTTNDKIVLLIYEMTALNGGCIAVLKVNHH
jgi:hypothetical protein